MEFFTSDTHFGHANIVRYCNRPFDSIEEMDEAIISNWNRVVSKSDTVYHLGDFSFKDPFIYKKRLNGKIVLIRGNHDHKFKNLQKIFDSVYDLLSLKLHGYYLVLSHYSMRVWDRSHYNSYNIYGHSHGRLPEYGKSYDVGVDSNNYTPINFGDLMEILDTKPNNFNYRG